MALYKYSNYFKYYAQTNSQTGEATLQDNGICLSENLSLHKKMFNLLEYIFSTTRLSEKQNNTADDTENGKQNKTLRETIFCYC